MSKIVVKDLYKIFGKKPQEALLRVKRGEGKEKIFADTGMTVGVNKAAFDIQEGEFFVIMGLSGSGKSTLIRLINRLIEPTSGQILIDGEDIVKMNQDQLMKTRRKKLGMVFQNFALFPHRNILQNVEFGLEVQGVPKEEREKKAREALEVVGLKGYEQVKPKELSGGMQQRVGLARALANDPDVLLMDEAFSALDPLIRKEMQDELLQLQGQLKKTILFITHDLDEALKIGDRIAIMKDGVIVQIGTPEEILTNPANEYVSTFVQDVDRSKVLLASHVMKQPDVVTTWKDGPRVAIRMMEEKGISSLFVVDKEKKLKGLLTIDAALQAVKENRWVEDMLTQDYHVTDPDTPVSELFGVAAEARYPIAVVSNDKFKGIVSRVSILSGLALAMDNDSTPAENDSTKEVNSA
ncbi:glycine betaine/L-proline ABC transporter ATP-binding protein [Ammoniphilus sp. YIM 78166]|uniref:quaternary amine ABC transporter ATP-binding protein n=1 Tax=Ammoniphilus sp. YIM 78166 TaxID=1644106 RepID=UPI00106FCFDA|nr:glycine betaine/L-proline ABC transporter ATP-binding protein [Ammoniphilus sp. YIM 78166]